MTDKQRDRLSWLQSELRKKRRLLYPLIIHEYKSDVFTEVDGVTIRIGPAGGIDLPTVRSYLDARHAAVNARKYFDDQRERDEANPKAITFKTGHFNPRFDPRTGRCSGELKCPCCR
jgi:hypothetical protein